MYLDNVTPMPDLLHRLEEPHFALEGQHFFDDFLYGIESYQNNKNIRDVFDEVCVNFEINKKFVEELHRYRVAFANKNEDHIAFFGGNLLGTHVVRFTTTDSNHWFSYILNVDDIDLEERLHRLPSIDSKRRGDGKLFVVSSDVFNLSCVWLCHAIFRAPGLSNEVKQEAMVDVLLVLQYKFITSLLFRYFRYPADVNVATAAYNELSMKYDIKRYGSWGALLRARAENALSLAGIHRKTIERMDNDDKVAYVLTDIQSRIRDTIKNIFDVMSRIAKSGSNISSTSTIGNIEGEDILKEKKNSFAEYTNYINQIIHDKQSFMKVDLMEAIKRMLPTMQPRLFIQTLEWLSDNYVPSTIKEMQTYLNDVLVHSFEYLVESGSNLRGSIDLPELLIRLRGVYTSSRGEDPKLLYLRSTTEEYVTLATRNRNRNIISAIRTGVLLYIVARAITRHHYSSVRFDEKKKKY